MQQQNLQQTVIPFLAVDLIKLDELASVKGILAVEPQEFFQGFLLAVGELKQIFKR